MCKGDTISGSVVSGFGLLFLISTLLNSNLTIVPTTSDGVPGAGFFPFILSCVLIVLGLTLIFFGLRQRNEDQNKSLSVETKENLKILFLVVAGLIVFLIVWQLTHLFFVWVLILSLYLNKVFKRSWKFTIIYSVSLTAVIYFVFSVAFSIQFN